MLGPSRTSLCPRTAVICLENRDSKPTSTDESPAALRGVQGLAAGPKKCSLTPHHLLAAAAARPAPTRPHASSSDPPLTHVMLVWREDISEDWLRFGRPIAERIIDRRARIESDALGQVFAFARWASNDYGTRLSTLAIVRAAGPGEAFTTLPQVDPGGDILLSVRGWPKVRTVFGLIDEIEQVGFDPCDVAPDHWRHIHNRLAGSMPSRRYDQRRHRAWLERRRLQS